MFILISLVACQNVMLLMFTAWRQILLHAMGKDWEISAIFSDLQLCLWHVSLQEWHPSGYNNWFWCKSWLGTGVIIIISRLSIVYLRHECHIVVQLSGTVCSTLYSFFQPKWIMFSYLMSKSVPPVQDWTAVPCTQLFTTVPVWVGGWPGTSCTVLPS